MITRMTAPITALTMEPTNPANGTKPKLRQQPGSDERADDSNDDVPDQSKTEPAHDLTSQPAGNRADDQHHDKAVDSNHGILPLLRNRSSDANVAVQ